MTSPSRVLGPCSRILSVASCRRCTCSSDASGEIGPVICSQRPQDQDLDTMNGTIYRKVDVKGLENMR